MTSYPLNPTDDIVGPIVHQLAQILTTQVSGLGRMYEEVPDGAPEDNSVLFPVSKFKFVEDTNGKIYIHLTIGIRYIVRRSKFSDNIQSLYNIFSSFARVLSSWPNQSLTDSNNVSHAITVCPKDGGFTQFVESGVPYVALIMNTEVLCEFNILTS